MLNLCIFFFLIIVTTAFFQERVRDKNDNARLKTKETSKDTKEHGRIIPFDREGNSSNSQVGHSLSLSPNSLASVSEMSDAFVRSD